MIRPVRNSTELNRFIRVPWSIYGVDPDWVPPIRSLQRKELRRESGAFFNDGFGSTAEYFLAYRNDKPVGRIAAIKNERHLRAHDDEVGFFGFFESIDDLDVARELLDAAREWLSERGLEVARGPTSFTLNEASGVMVEGWGRRPSVEMGYTPPYYSGLLENCGFRKSRDLLAYEADLSTLEDSLFRVEEIADAAVAKGYSTRMVSRKNLESEVEIFSEVFSKAWERNWGSFPFLQDDFRRLAKEMGPFFDERLGQVAYLQDEPVGVFLAAPDPWELFQHFDGKLGVRQLWKVMKERHRISRYRTFLMGILPDQATTPIGPLWFREVMKLKGYFPDIKTMEFSWILEDNVATRKLVESFGAEIVQRLRIYDAYL